MASPAGPISLAEDHLRTTLANVAAFRTWCGAADVAAAKLKIHNDSLPDPAGEVYTETELSTYAPYAILHTDPSNGYRMTFSDKNSDGSHNYVDEGQLQLWLVQFVNVAHDVKTAERTFKNSLGQILDGLWDLAGQADYLAITLVDLDELVRVHPDDEPGQGDQQLAKITIGWGVV
jgi:hypothetical protein